MALAERLEFALERLKPSQWELFERFVSSFLSIDYPDIRTMANSTGDGGRDSELFSPTGNPSVVLQYSVSKDWKKKIAETVKRLKEYIGGDQIQLLIYVSPHVIGAAADTLRKEILSEYGHGLDIYDRTWFVERVNNNDAQILAAENLARQVVDPILLESNIRAASIAGFDTEELQVAHLFLALQVKDSTQDRNLTRASFNAITLSILRKTNSDNRMTRSAIISAAHSLFPDAAQQEVAKYVQEALLRLTKHGDVKHWPKADEFCLSYQKIQEVAEKVAATDSACTCVLGKIASSLLEFELPSESVPDLAECVLDIVEEYLGKRGEAFCMSIAEGHAIELAQGDLTRTITARLAHDMRLRTLSKAGLEPVEVVGGVMQTLFSDSATSIEEYLRSKASAYALLAFLKKTPNVKKVCRRIAGGKAWLDACILLPLLAETLLEPERCYYTRLIRNAASGGMQLYVTRGVLEEVQAHMNRSIACSHYTITEWRGSIPYLFMAHCESGEAAMDFSDWIYGFQGDSDHVGNIASYLADELSVTLNDFTDVDTDSFAFSGCLLEYWRTMHEKRFEHKGLDANPDLVLRLARHDSDTYLGVLATRKHEENSPLGYNSWWLTLDRAAYRAPTAMKVERLEWDHVSPAMSVDFLANYVSFNSAAPDRMASMPVMSDFIYMPFVTPEILEAVMEIRKTLEGKPPRFIKRKIRDHVHSMRQRLGFHADTMFANVLERSSEESFDFEV